MAETAHLISHLSWDSMFFDIKIGKVTRGRLDSKELSEVTQQAEALDYDCVYWQAEPNPDMDLSGVQQRGFRWVDLRVELQRSISPDASPSRSVNHPTRSATHTDLPLL